MLPLGFWLTCGKRVKYRCIEFFVFDSDSLPCLLSLFFWSGVTFPLVALDKISPHFAYSLRMIGCLLCNYFLLTVLSRNLKERILQ